MKVGTKSVLFGAHCFLLHPIFVALGWIKLYGFPLDPRIWIAFFVHDLGYWGKPNMDGTEGETHVELGAKIMSIFDYRFLVKEIHSIYRNYPYYTNLGYKSIFQFKGYALIKRNTHYWHDFSLYHSRYYAKKNNKPVSKLCFADKLAFSYTPQILYILMTSATGEIYEYMRQNDCYKDKSDDWSPNFSNKVIWHKDVDVYMRDWVKEHKDGREDTWTDPDLHTISNTDIAS